MAETPGRRADVALRLVQTVAADGEHLEPSPFGFLGACARVMVGSEPPHHLRTRGELTYEVAVASTLAVSNALLFEWARR